MTLPQLLMTMLMTVIIILVLCNLKNYNSSESYSNYSQMSHLPWCSPPLDQLPECQGLKGMYPGIKFPTGKLPVSCKPEKISIYETGNTLNPNTTSVWGPITADEIPW